MNTELIKANFIENGFLEKDFAQFEQAFTMLVQAKGNKGDVSRENRLLNLRFRLSLDLQIGIKTALSETKTDNVKNAYICIFKFMDLWNVFELSLRSGKVRKSIKTEKITELCDKDFEAMEICKILDTALSKLQSLIEKNKNAEYFVNYKNHLYEITTEGTALQNVLAEIKPDAPLTRRQFFALMYAERNAYYHGGEAARAHAPYSFRQEIVNIYITTLQKIIARFGAKLFQAETNNETGV